jgi:hypothetical protein
MVDCGKARRTAHCEAHPSGCGSDGDAIVEFANALAASVASKEMSDAEARRKFIEFKTSRRDEYRRDQRR